MQPAYSQSTVLLCKLRSSGERSRRLLLLGGLKLRLHLHQPVPELAKLLLTLGQLLLQLLLLCSGLLAGLGQSLFILSTEQSGQRNVVSHSSGRKCECRLVGCRTFISVPSCCFSRDTSSSSVARLSCCSCSSAARRCVREGDGRGRLESEWRERRVITQLLPTRTFCSSSSSSTCPAAFHLTLSTVSSIWATFL